MDWLQFIASIIDSLAWPGAILAAVILLRRPLSALLPLLRRLKYKGFEVEFDREVRKLREEAVAALPPLPKTAPPQIPEETALIELALVAPRAAVLESWLLVESAARRVLAARGMTKYEEPLTGPQLAWALADVGLLDSSSRSVFDKLRRLRIQAVHAHDFEISEGASRDYVELALEFARHLKKEGR